MKRNCFTLLLAVLIITPLTIWGAPENYQEAKKAAKRIWENNRVTFYCGCSFDRQGNVDFSSCDYKPTDKRKDKKITWEHVVPVSWFGRRLPCWNEACQLKNGQVTRGRECCREKDKRFKEMEADLHNLVPAVRSINMARKNYPFGEFYSDNKKKHFYHECQIIIDNKYRVVEPHDEIKGVIARIHFYMAKKYQIPLTQQQRNLLASWDQRYPAKTWEKNWNQKVAQVQGNLNEFIK